jgi:glycosyltransferase involved in cell wall biosynthesis
LELVEASDLKNRVHFVSNVTNEELADIYAGATASFFPSLYEGFGLPILESMACGTPCVTCRNSSLPEIGGEAAIYVDPLDIDAMSDVMERFENNDYNIAELQAKSLAQASHFSWKKCARQTVEVYKQCLEL